MTRRAGPFGVGREIAVPVFYYRESKADMDLDKLLTGAVSATPGVEIRVGNHPHRKDGTRFNNAFFAKARVPGIRSLRIAFRVHPNAVRNFDNSGGTAGYFFAPVGAPPDPLSENYLGGTWVEKA